MEEFKRLAAIKHYKNVKFNLDRTLKDMPKRAINDNSLKKEFTIASMNSSVMEHLIAGQHFELMVLLMPP